jgi:ABC-type phosphate/phosphonate transport system substrate-binding protein
MNQSRVFSAAAAALAASLLGLGPPSTASEKEGQPAGYVRIGMVNSLFRDISPATRQMSLQPFSSLVRSQTGLDGRPVLAGDALALARQLQENKVQFGVFHGVEFAWAQEKYPDLRPLVIVINRHRHLRAHLVTRYDSPTRSLADLKGKKLALPRGSREHCHLFLDRFCSKGGTTAKAYFGEVVVHPNIEEALDDVLRRKVDAAVVDGVSLECYQKLKPGCHSALKAVERSPVFPAAVVAYRQGAVDGGKLAQLRDGLIKANQNTRTRELMFQWRLTAFEAVPADYQQTLTAIRKTYPCPGKE